LQSDPHNHIANRPDERLWDESHSRFETNAEWTLQEGPIIEKGMG
jgi:hypothetical protein